MKTCSTEDCGKKVTAKGLCQSCYDKTPERVAKARARTAAWVKANPEKKRASDKAYAERNKDRILAKHQEYYRQNRSERLAYQKEYHLRNLDVRQEAERLHAAENRAKNPELVKARIARWKRGNPEAVNAATHKRRARLREIPGHWTAEEWKDRCAEYGNVCPRCQKHCAQFTIDHIIPLAHPDSCNWIWNLQPLCKSCNSAKQDNERIYYPPPCYSL